MPIWMPMRSSASQSITSILITATYYNHQYTGAFHMWEQLKVPIVPLIFYGAYELYPASSWVNNTGESVILYSTGRSAFYAPFLFISSLLVIIFRVLSTL